MVTHHNMPSGSGYSPPQLPLNMLRAQSLGSPGTNVHPRREYTERDWERRKSVIAAHYLHSNKTLEEVVRVLKERYQFYVTIEQLKRQVGKWGFVKKMTRKVQFQIGRMVRERRRQFPNRDITVKFRDKFLSVSKVRAWETEIGDEDDEEDVVAGIQIYTLDRDGAPLAEIIETCAATTAIDYLRVPQVPLGPRHVAVDALLAYAQPLEDPTSRPQYSRLVQEATSKVYPGIKGPRGIILSMNSLRTLLTNPDDPVPADMARKMFSAYVCEVLQKFPKTMEENISPFVTMAIYLSLFLWADPNTRNETTFAMAAVHLELRKEKYLHPEFARAARNFHMHALLHLASLLASLRQYSGAAEILDKPELEPFHGLPAVQNPFWDCRRCLDLLIDDDPEAHFSPGFLEDFLSSMSFPEEAKLGTPWWQDSDTETSCDIGFRTRYCGIKYDAEAGMTLYESSPYSSPKCRHRLEEQTAPTPRIRDDSSDTLESDTSGLEFTPDSAEATGSSVSVTWGTPSSGEIY